ncbi:alanine dehydrogenase [Halanaerobium saccharolyticum]|jgi:alanine dehydrogenase|uniref:Alanine dehydrogenase n=1 Tax=Halanaerobium saccharolyticum TaxID=43595 RepID=A0A4R6RPT1_9FIRM|nr:alanine dehydrogenase [Halanaerobium saccharolyticum]TDP88644.1 alanine dehydrogenase [Halanaerobium saccharolyticum]
MIIAVPKEIKNNENRVALTAAGTEILKKAGHQILIEKNAGKGSGISDQDYKEAGAEILADKKELFDRAEMIIKVKEPLKEEYNLFKEGQILFTYLHLAADQELTEALKERGVTAVAYETVQTEDGELPLLTPMSEVAGRLSVQAAASFLEKPKGGSGMLLGGVPGVKPAKVVVIGGGIVGRNAAKIALGMGADVTIMDIKQSTMRYIDDTFPCGIKTIMSNQSHVAEEVKEADVVIGAVLIPGAKAPNLVTEEMIKTMTNGSVVVDVAIDQGGCIEGTYPTTHDDPVFTKHGVIHYSVANMPGAVARTSTFALTNATLPYIKKLAARGYKKAMLNDYSLALGLNIYQGEIICQAVAESFNQEYKNLDKLLESWQ